MATLVAEGIGYTTLTKEFAQPYVLAHKLIILNKGKTHDVQPMLAWYERPEAPRYFSGLITAIC